ncbi:hypothetical protein MNV49_002073 [Pseudohyphozyma bogoriensis]|nr:hypothetical protein MNV49_002073 [Pseudohyphozyma bogoriensis]
MTSPRYMMSIPYRPPQHLTFLRFRLGILRKSSEVAWAASRSFASYLLREPARTISNDLVTSLREFASESHRAQYSLPNYSKQLGKTAASKGSSADKKIKKVRFGLESLCSSLKSADQVVGDGESMAQGAASLPVEKLNEALKARLAPFFSRTATDMKKLQAALVNISGRDVPALKSYLDAFLLKVERVVEVSENFAARQAEWQAEGQSGFERPELDRAQQAMEDYLQSQGHGTVAMSLGNRVVLSGRQRKVYGRAQGAGGW